MTYQQAGRIAVLKRILGWVIFIPALISTLISLLKFMNTRQENQEGINAVMLDFTHVMIDMMQANTPFLNLFWYNSPTPNFNGGVNVMFWVIFILIFVGLALQDSGARMSRQARFLREGVEDQLILEKAKGEEGLTREQIEVLLFRTILFSCSFSRCISCRLFVLLQVMCSFLCLGLFNQKAARSGHYPQPISCC